MIISHSYKFIYVRARKTASTSIELALSQMLEDDDVITPVCDRDEKIRLELGSRRPQNYQGKKKLRFYNHMPAYEIKHVVGDDIWNSYFKFCFERNPWDKVISLYYHRYKTDPRPAFREFLESGEFADALNFPLYTIDNQVVMDFIGRYENLEDDLALICKRLKLPMPFLLPKAKSQFRKDQRHYREILTEEEKQIIATAYAKEIDYFHYQY